MDRDAEIENRLSIFDEKTRAIIRADIAKIGSAEKFYRNGSDALQMGIPKDSRNQVRGLNAQQLLFDALASNGEAMGKVEDVNLSNAQLNSSFGMFSDLSRKRPEMAYSVERNSSSLDKNPRISPKFRQSFPSAQEHEKEENQIAEIQSISKVLKFVKYFTMIVTLLLLPFITSAVVEMYVRRQDLKNV